MSLVHRVIPYTTEADWKANRAQDLTSTDIAAAFGLSPYCSAFELWHRKRGSYFVDDGATTRKSWGNRLQDAIAHGVADDMDWDVRRMDDYIRLEGLRVGSSFDFCMASGDPALLEIKNVDGLVFRNEWAEQEGSGIVAPDHIELQVQHQMLVSGLTVCHIAALVGGNRLEILRREYQPDVGAAILAKAEAFWSGPEPAPDFTRDVAVIARLNGLSDPGAYMEAPEDSRIAELMEAYGRGGEREREAKQAKDEAKAELLTLIGKAEKVTCGRFTLNAKTVGETFVEGYTRASYRGWRLTEKKK